MQETAISARPDITDKRLIRNYAYIDGKWTDSESGASIAVTDPASGQEIGTVAKLSVAQSQTAVDAAQRAFATWSGMLPQATQALTVGRGMDDCDIGPLMNESSVQKQEAHVADALAKGATLACGGKRHNLGPLFYQPTVLTDVPADADILFQETFGPVIPVAAFDSEDEVIARANDTEYGLVAYVHTEDPRRIYRVSRALQFGMVAVNRTKITGAPIPFGGTKQSGLAREGARLGMQEFMELNYVCRDWA